MIPSGFTIRPFERRTLNYLINEYLLMNNYKLTSVTFGEENEASDLEDWDSIGLNCARPPDLTQLYRWYCHQLCAENETSTKEDFSMFVNFDENLQDEYRNLKIAEQQAVCCLLRLIFCKLYIYLFFFSIDKQHDLVTYAKRISLLEEENSNLNIEIHLLQHEKNNLVIQLQLLQNRSTSEEASVKIEMEDTMQLNSSRHLPQVYRRTFERLLLINDVNNDKQDEEIELNYDHEQKMFEEIIRELNMLSLDRTDLLNLIIRSITRINLHLNGSKKLVSKSITHDHFDKLFEIKMINSGNTRRSKSFVTF